MTRCSLSLMGQLFRRGNKTIKAPQATPGDPVIPEEKPRSGEEPRGSGEEVGRRGEVTR